MQMLRPFGLAVFVVMLCLTVEVRPLPGQTPKAKEEEKLTLQVNYDATQAKLPAIVAVEVYRDGKRLVYDEVHARKRASWELPAGEYEVHMSAAGWAKAIKRVKLSWEGRTPGDWGLRAVNVEMDEKQPVVIGDGPSLQQLQRELTELRETVKRLQEEVKQLKGK